jgi:hypothetical protein
MQETILYWVLSLGIGASSCSGSLKFFCGIGWAAEGTGARRLKSGLGTDFCQRCDSISTYLLGAFVQKISLSRSSLSLFFDWRDVFFSSGTLDPNFWWWRRKSFVQKINKFLTFLWQVT